MKNCSTDIRLNIRALFSYHVHCGWHWMDTFRAISRGVRAYYDGTQIILMGDNLISSGHIRYKSLRWESSGIPRAALLGESATLLEHKVVKIKSSPHCSALALATLRIHEYRDIFSDMPQFTVHLIMQTPRFANRTASKSGSGAASSYYRELSAPSSALLASLDSVSCGYWGRWAGLSGCLADNMFFFSFFKSCIN